MFGFMWDINEVTQGLAPRRGAGADGPGRAMGATYHLSILVGLCTFYLDFALEKALFCIFVFLGLSHWLRAGEGVRGAEPPG